MKTKPICTLFFSLSFLLGLSQKRDSAKVHSWKYAPNFMVGVDVLSGGTAFFSDRKLFQGFVSSRINKRTHAIVEAGFERNLYQKNGYDASVNGPFVKIGGFYMMVTDRENDFNGFYLGSKLAASLYSQEYRAVPIRGIGNDEVSQAFPTSNQSSYWVEAIAGGRIKLFDTNFYIDVNLQPKYLIYNVKQEDIYPMIVPGFGRSSGKFNIGFAWNIAYKF